MLEEFHKRAALNLDCFRLCITFPRCYVRLVVTYFFLFYRRIFFTVIKLITKSNPTKYCNNGSFNMVS